VSSFSLELIPQVLIKQIQHLNNSTTFLNFNFTGLIDRRLPLYMRELALVYYCTAHDMLVYEEIGIVDRLDLCVLVFVYVFEKV
jgi:hypothetical protein